MTKLNKIFYITAKGEKKINCYTVTIPKSIVEKTNINDNKLKIYAKENKIIIEKEK